MKVIVTILTTLILALWAIAFAIISVQNAIPISLQFFNLQSIDIPLGITLAFSFAVGAIVASIILPILFSKNSKRQETNHEHQEV